MSKNKNIKKCKHKSVFVMCLDGIENAYRLCVNCDAVGVWGLGPANDADLNVQREIDAARVIAERLLAPWLTMPYATTMTHAEDAGYCVNESSPHFDSPAWHIGYLVRCAVDGDGAGWPWDATRPVAGQFEALPYDARTGTTRHTVPGADQHDEPMTASPAIAPDHFDDEAFDTSDMLPETEAR